jgi:hypothetical protein
VGRPAQYLWQHPLAYLRAQRKWTYRELVELGRFFRIILLTR